MRRGAGDGRARVAILISGAGSNMAALADAMRAPDFPAVPALVLADRADAGGIEKARRRKLPVAVVDRRGYTKDRASFEAELLARLADAEADLVCLAGFMRILSPGFVAMWRGRILNIHPSLLPLFPGLDTHARALAAGVAVHGCTVHEVTEELDAGPIIAQGAVPAVEADTPDSLAARVLLMEHRLYPEALRRVARGDRRRFALFHETGA